jgi:hypothetical protein
MREEGYIKFYCTWHRKPVVISAEDFEIVSFYRDALFKKGLIGAYPDGIGFGNISFREKVTGKVIITGSATGNYKSIQPRHFTRVLDYSFEMNLCECEGPIKASSETLSHMALYRNPFIQSVIHVHNLKMWQKYKNVLPTTPGEAEFGTVELAEELSGMASGAIPKIIVMGGHEEGLIIPGRSIKDAFEFLMVYYSTI